MAVSSDYDTFPYLNMSANTVPELKDKKVGGECMLMVKVKIKSITDDNSGGNVDMDILEAAYYEEDEKDGEEY